MRRDPELAHELRRRRHETHQRGRCVAEEAGQQREADKPSSQPMSGCRANPSDVRDYKEGKVDWTKAGLPLETGAAA